MQAEQFVYWLNGFVEITSASTGDTPPDAKEWQVIVDHLKLVHNKQTPDRSLTTQRPSIGQYLLENPPIDNHAVC